MTLIEKLWRAHCEALAGGPAIGRSLIAAVEVNDYEVCPEVLCSRYELVGEHPYFAKEDWASAVANGDTLCGYWEWVSNELLSIASEVPS